MNRILLICALINFAAIYGVNTKDENTKIFENGLKIEVVSLPENCEKTSKSGDYLKLHYSGTLEDGTQFDSSYERKQPFQFELGAGKVIKGWDEGLQDMCVGESRRLTIPPELAYGEKGFKDVIPPYSTLIFEVQLISIDETKASDDMFVEIDADGDGMLSQDEVSSFIKKEEAESGVEEMTSDADHNSLVADIFQKEDLDKDGFISSEEFFRPRHEEL